MLEPRFDKISELLVEYSLGKFDSKIELTEKQDEIDAFISSINMLGEELKVTTISKNYFNNIFNSVSDMLFVLNQDGEVENVSQSVKEKLKISIDSIKGKQIDTFFHKKSSLFRQVTDVLKKKGNTAELEADLFRSDGTTIPVSCSGTYLTTENKEKLGYLLVARDLTNIKQIELSLKHSEEKYRKIFSESSDPIFILDKLGRIVDFNKAGLGLFKYADEDLKKLNYFKFFHNQQESKQFIKEINQKGLVIDFKVKLLDSFNHTIDCLISANKILNERGQIAGYQGIIKDITKQKETENLVIRTIVDTQEQERKRFAKDLHDSMGQQLSAIKFYLSTLNSFSEVQENRRFNDILSKSVSVLDNVITELRNVCFNLMPRTLENFGLVYAITELCRKIEFEKILEFDFVVSENFPELEKTLEIALFRIIQEFINNSIKHGKATKIIMELKSEDNNIHIYLRDNGKGFDFNNVDYMQGMGLKNIKSRVQSYNGEITIESTLGTGTKFKITIPYI